MTKRDLQHNAVTLIERNRAHLAAPRAGGRRRCSPCRRCSTSSPSPRATPSSSASRGSPPCSTPCTARSGSPPAATRSPTPAASSPISPTTSPRRSRPSARRCARRPRRSARSPGSPSSRTACARSDRRRPGGSSGSPRAPQDAADDLDHELRDRFRRARPHGRRPCRRRRIGGRPGLRGMAAQGDDGRGASPTTTASASGCRRCPTRSPATSSPSTATPPTARRERRPVDQARRAQRRRGAVRAQGRRAAPARHDGAGLQQRHRPDVVGARRSSAARSCSSRSLTLPIAGLMARRAFVDDRDRRRRPAAIELKRMAHRYLDEVGFVVHKDARDAIRAIHRQVREHYLERAERLERTLQPGEGRGRAGPPAQRRAGRRPSGGRSSRPPTPCSRVRRAAERLIAAVPAQGGVTVSGDACSTPCGDCSTRPSRSSGRPTPRASPSCASASTRRCASPSPGKVKAGKSTLLNALVGEKVAPTDASECTKVVTWYRNSHVYRVDGDPVGRPAHRAAVPAHRRGVGGRPRRARRRRPAVRRRRVADRAPPRRDAHRHARPGVDLRRHLDALAALPRHATSRAPARPTPSSTCCATCTRRTCRSSRRSRTASRPRGTSVNSIAVISRADEIGSSRTNAMATAETGRRALPAVTRGSTRCARRSSPSPG